MKTKLLSTLLLSVSLTWSVSSSAGTIGTLSWDGTSDYIEDSASSTTYLQLGLLRGLTYSQTLAATNPDGVAAGYHIASQTEAYSFFNAMYGVPDGAVDEINDVNEKHEILGNTFDDGVLGNNFNAFVDGVVFMSDAAVDTVGLIQLLTGSNELYLWEFWTSRIGYDNFYNIDLGIYFTFLMVSDETNVSAVPIPAAAFMFAPALLGFAALRRKKRT